MNMGPLGKWSGGSPTRSWGRGPSLKYFSFWNVYFIYNILKCVLYLNWRWSWWSEWHRAGTPTWPPYWWSEALLGQKPNCLLCQAWWHTLTRILWKCHKLKRILWKCHTLTKILWQCHKFKRILWQCHKFKRILWQCHMFKRIIWQCHTLKPAKARVHYFPLQSQMEQYSHTVRVILCRTNSFIT